MLSEKTINKLLEPFSFTFGQLQDISVLIKHLQTNDITVDDFIGYIRDKKLKMIDVEKLAAATLKSKQEEWALKALKCPACQTPMNLFPVNTRPGNQTGDDSKSVWMCPKCWETTYNPETVAKILAGVE